MTWGFSKEVNNIIRFTSNVYLLVQQVLHEKYWEIPPFCLYLGTVQSFLLSKAEPQPYNLSQIILPPSKLRPNQD